MSARATCFSDVRLKVCSTNMNRSSRVPMQFERNQLEKVQTVVIEDNGIAAYWRVVRKRALLIATICVFCVAAGYLSTLAGVPVYQARTSLEVIPVDEHPVGLSNSPAGYTNQTLTQAHIETQVELLRSEALLTRLAGVIGPERIRSAFSQQGRMPEALGIKAVPIQTDEDIRRVLKRNLRVRPSPRANIVEVLFDAPDPKLAADIVNTLAAEHAGHSMEVRWETAQRTAKWLSQQLQEVKDDLTLSEARLQEFGRKSGLMLTADASNVAEIKLKQLQEELSKVQADRIQKQSLYHWQSRRRRNRCRRCSTTGRCGNTSCDCRSCEGSSPSPTLRSLPAITRSGAFTRRSPRLRRRCRRNAPMSSAAFGMNMRRHGIAKSFCQTHLQCRPAWWKVKGTF
jgi:capsular polysaccharide biosynthesis protein